MQLSEDLLEKNSTHALLLSSKNGSALETAYSNIKSCSKVDYAKLAELDGLAEDGSAKATKSAGRSKRVVDGANQRHTAYVC